MCIFKNREDKMAEKYGADYWNNKWPKAPILYNGRALRGKKDNISVDVKEFLATNDALLDEVVRKYKLKKLTLNETAWEVQKWVVRFLTYKYDEEANQCPEFWQFPFETLQSQVGDCEDGAILIASLMVASGIPAWRVKIAAGYVQESATAPQGGHAYCLYLADRPDEERKLGWEVHDWCYFEDSKTKTGSKILAKNGGYNNCYKEVWFTFNNEFSWNQKALEINDRISGSAKKKTQLDEAVNTVNTLKEIMSSINEKYRA
jgi:transglutaminase-like putative cysteine protease